MILGKGTAMKIRGLESNYAVFRAQDWRVLHVLCIGAKTRLKLQVAPCWPMLPASDIAPKIKLNRARI